MSVIQSQHVRIGKNYRLFPNSKRAIYMLVKATGKDLKTGKAIFLYKDDTQCFERIITDVEPHENVIETS